MNVYFVQTGLNKDVCIQQAQDTLKLFGLEFAQLYRGNIVQIPFCHRNFDGEVPTEGIKGYANFSKVVTDRLAFHRSLYNSEPAYIYLDYEPKLGPNGEPFLITDYMPSANCLLDIVYRSQIVRAKGSSSGFGMWSLGKHLGRGRHTPEQLAPVSSVIAAAGASVVFPNYYPRVHNDDHQTIVDSDFAWWTETVGIPRERLFPCVQFRVKHQEVMDPNDAYTLIRAVRSKYNNMVIWMQAEEPSQIELWNSYHRPVAEAVRDAVAEAPKPQSRG